MSYYSKAIEEARPFFKPDESEAPLAVIGELMNFILTARSVLAGDTGDDTRQGMSQLMMGFTIGLSDNAFWRQHASYIMPIFANAVTSWGDSFGYLADENEQNRVAFVACANAMAEVTVAVLYCAEGAAAVKKHSMKLRLAFMATGEK